MNIKPCPFCGKEVQIRSHLGDHGYTPDTVSIRCRDCGCGFVEDTQMWDRFAGHYDVTKVAKDIILQKWNKRFDSDGSAV